MTLITFNTIPGQALDLEERLEELGVGRVFFSDIQIVGTNVTEEGVYITVLVS